MAFFKNLFKSKPARTGIVFVVEDNPAYAKTLKVFLSSGFPGIKKVEIFPVGETCIMELHQHPDLIIIDYFLDSKYHDAETGLETIRKIRAGKPDTKIIVLSAQSEIGEVSEAVKKYNFGYVKKDAEAFQKLREIVKEIYPVKE